MVRVALVADEGAGTRAFKLLSTTDDVQIAAVITSSGSSLDRLAKAEGGTTFEGRVVRDPEFGKTLVGLEVDLLINVHSLYLIKGDVIAAPRIGSFNLHPSALPRRAGLNAPSWAIWERDEEHGVTLHWMTPGVDTGDIAYQERFPLTPRDTALSVSAKGVRFGLGLIEKLVEAAKQGESAIPRVAQDLSLRTYHRRADRPAELALDWGQEASDIERLARACFYFPGKSPWGQPHWTVAGREVGLLQCAVVGSDSVSLKPGEFAAVDDDRHCLIGTGSSSLLVESILVDGEAADGSRLLSMVGSAKKN